MPSYPYESYLQEIANLITIRDEDRPICTKDYDRIRDHVLNGMCFVDNVFNKLYKGTSLFGSYANNVRIKYPGEFDVIFILSIPYSSHITVTRDVSRPGYVRLDLRNTLDEMSENYGYSDVYDHFYELVDNYYYLRRSKLQTWLEEVVEDCLDERGNQVRGCMGDLYTLTYSKRGLAHTIFAKCSIRSLSIDFIPGICFGSEEWMKIVPYPKFKFWDNSYQWYAVPKPPSDRRRSRCLSFMIANPRVERKLLLDRQNLKVVFRLLKSLRNAYKLDRLKSYFITTAFLWEIERQSDAFWQSPLYVLLEHMLYVLAKAFYDGHLLFYWDRENNLLDILSDEEIGFYAQELRRAYTTLKQYKTEPNLTLKRCRTHFELP
ncbi:PREDICTED: uncharacterized protein LOC108371033 [Rhagoletis zephyria]|uniref:uncharacterized protein LOC108371033 n=1 Tax=Rhagoletis zephyria TaxID=28612 RepID=UPI00081134E1|nr:PREDICTED: uncharacterized protein LOC108371033 [Rhagoletis zephyria]XP_017482020.1 PREDICTED: uncharacterized protein LOC108371033 [Rhagoletis zephyria]XP_017482023.1 PREDICTED: uncharacterized protein LOC108371033 [Rhagoletis zephyria]XP_017482028.1 PREDICTED: uncharacterized protein LOC108371033 [Rhagoletis zephyria]